MHCRVETHDTIENIPFYRNQKTGVVRWDIPLDVRTYLTPDSEAKVSSQYSTDCTYS